MEKQHGSGAGAHLGMSNETEADALIERYASVLDPSLILAIANEPGQSTDEASKILDALVETVPPECVQEKPVSAELTLLFLQQSFPYVAYEKLETLLISSDGDIDMVIDKLYAEDMLAQEPTMPVPKGLDYDALADGLASKKSKPSNKFKKRTTGPITVSLTDQRSPHHIYYDKRVPRPSSKLPDTSVDTFGLTDEEMARKLQNAERDAADAASEPVADQQWLLASSSLSQLAVLLGMSPARIQSLFHQSSFNLHLTFGRAVEAAMISPQAQEAAQAPEFATTCASLASITEETEREIARLLQAAQGHQDAVLDLLQLRNVIREAADGLVDGPDILDPAGRIGTHRDNAERVTSTQSVHKPVTGSVPHWLPSGDAAFTYAGRASRAGVSRAESHQPGGITLPASAGRVAMAPAWQDEMDDHVYSSEDCRERAAEYRARRNEALQQAARSAQQSRTSRMGGAAMVYAEEARKYDMEARRWQLRASSALVDQRRLDAQSSGHDSRAADRIDLHGLTVHEALTVVAQHVARWQSTPLGEARSRPPLEIITGRGVHSRHSVSVIRPAIERYLRQRGFRVDTVSNAGALYVKAPTAT